MRFYIAAPLVLSLSAGLGLNASAQDLGSCPGSDFVETELKNSSSSGYYIPGLKLIVMNKAVLEHYSVPVQKFIFAHECAHSDPAVGEDEAEADCSAIKKGVSEGWIGRPEVIQVCAHLARFPADATHAPIGVRCTYIRQCSGLFDPPRPVHEQEASAPPAVPSDSNATPLTRLARSMD